MVPCLSFRDKLEARVAATDSLLCVGLDPHQKELMTAAEWQEATTESKADAAYTFCKTLIDSTVPYAACYKPNIAFFEAIGDAGGAALHRVLQDIPVDIPILLDCKRGDIGSTAMAYAEAAYDVNKADAVTLSPLMGWDSVQPFVMDKYSDKGAFLLCKTSNPGSNELLASQLSSGELVYERIAKLVHAWGKQTPALLGLVVGATDPIALRRAREAAGNDVWILAPGVGAQGGDLEAALQAGLNVDGTGVLIPVSRGISHAENAAVAAKKLCESIRIIRQNAKQSSQSLLACNSMQPFQKEFIKFALQQSVLKFGSFVLKSGRTSPYFFNAGLFASGESLFKLGKAYASTIMSSTVLSEGPNKVKFDVVFGPAYKGISLGALVSSVLYSDFGVDVGFAYNRKEAKDHGEGGSLVGADIEGKRVLIVDDVITAGTAIREAFGLLKASNAHPVGVVIALDRAEIRSLEDKVSAVQAVSRDLSLDVVSIVALPQLQLFLESEPDKYGADTLKNVEAYRSDYGV